jgi:hypothetical protein
VAPLRGSVVFPVDGGLMPTAKTNVAAARLMADDR